jgi:hypothetical protein
LEVEGFMGKEWKRRASWEKKDSYTSEYLNT